MVNEDVIAPASTRILPSNRKLVVLHPGVCDPWQPSTLICISFHPMSEVPNAKGLCTPWSGRYSFYHATCEQVKTTRIGAVLSLSDAGGTLAYLSCLGNNFIEQLYSLQMVFCVVKKDRDSFPQPCKSRQGVQCKIIFFLAGKLFKLQLILMTDANPIRTLLYKMVT